MNNQPQIIDLRSDNAVKNKDYESTRYHLQRISESKKKVTMEDLIMKNINLPQMKAEQKSAHHLVSNPTRAAPSSFHSQQAISTPHAPLWFNVDVNLLPTVYQQVFQLVFDYSTNLIDTQKVFGVFTDSGLPQATLGAIWDAVSRSHPGILTIPELFLALGMIAMEQNFLSFRSTTPNGNDIAEPILHVSVDYVSAMLQPPIPYFSSLNSKIASGYHASMTMPAPGIDPFQRVTSTSEFVEDWGDFVSAEKANNAFDSIKPIAPVVQAITPAEDSKTVQKSIERLTIDLLGFDANPLPPPVTAVSTVNNVSVKPDEVDEDLGFAEFQTANVESIPKLAPPNPPILQDFTLAPPKAENHTVEDPFHSMQPMDNKEEDDFQPFAEATPQLSGVEQVTGVFNNPAVTAPSQEITKTTKSAVVDMKDLRAIFDSVTDDEHNLSMDNNFSAFSSNTITSDPMQKSILEMWFRCATQVKRKIEEANSIFVEIPSPSVCSEVAASKEGINYIQALEKIFHIVKRIVASDKAIGYHDPTLSSIFKETDILWHNFTAFVPHYSIWKGDDFFADTYTKNGSQEDRSKHYCGICLHKVKPNGPDLVTYSSRIYHAPCANFWVNCVDLTLPYIL